MEPMNEKGKVISLIQSAQMGKEAFEQLVLHYQHDVFRLIRVYTRNDGEAEDLAQETWVKIYKSIGKLKPPYHLESWINKIAVNTAKNWRKSRWYKESQATDEIAPQQLGATVIVEHQRQALIERIRETIDSLSAKHRQVISDFYIFGYSASEISQRLNLPLSTVTSRLQEARKQLREEFETMIAMSRIQEKFAPDNFAKNVMERVGSLPTPVPKGNIIEAIGKHLPKQLIPIIGMQP